MIVVGAIAAPQKSGKKIADISQTAATTTDQGKAEPAKSPLPEKQLNFISAIADYKKRFASASNELQESALKDERGTSLVGLLGPQLSVGGWTGTIRRLETNTEGKAAIAIRLSPDADILTANNSLSDIVYPTMIDKGTPVYKALMNMSVGDKVVISGTFIPSDEGGVLESSLTIAGAMNAPEFLFRFTDISKN